MPDQARALQRLSNALKGAVADALTSEIPVDVIADQLIDLATQIRPD